MNSNLPIPISNLSKASQAPFSSCQTAKKRNTRILVRLFLLFLLVFGIPCLAMCLPSTLKSNILSFLGVEHDTTLPKKDLMENEADSLYHFDFSLVSPDAHAVLPCDLSAKTQGLFLEDRSENPKIASFAPLELSHLLSTTREVTVLVTNTHPYESYSKTELFEYNDTSFASGQDEAQSVKAIANAFVSELQTKGIRAVYVDSHVIGGMDSYQTACDALETALAIYPHVQYVFDLHRDILFDESGNMLRPVTSDETGTMAQIRLVAGAGCDVPYEKWETSVRSHLSLAEAIFQNDPRLLMPTEISRSRLNQHLPCTVFTVEVGSCGNSIEEAKRSAKKLAAIFSETVLGKEKNQE